MINLHDAVVFNSPGDIASWPETAAITALTLSPEQGVAVDFTTKAAWPDFVPPGWTGPVVYTLWAVVKVNGVWVTSGFIQMWRNRPGSGAYESGSFLPDFHKNWAYDARWGALADYRPAAGDTVGFFVSAGNARGESGVTSLRERSNVVEVQLPANDRLSLLLSAPTLPVAPPVVAAPAPIPTDAQQAAQFAAIGKFIADTEAKLDALNLKLDALAIKPPPAYTGTVFGVKFTLTPSQ